MRKKRFWAQNAHSDVIFASILVDIVSPHIIAKHNLLNDGNEVEGDEESEEREGGREGEIVQVFSLEEGHLVEEGSYDDHQDADAQDGTEGSHLERVRVEQGLRKTEPRQREREKRGRHAARILPVTQLTGESYANALWLETMCGITDDLLVTNTSLDKAH